MLGPVDVREQVAQLEGALARLGVHVRRERLDDEARVGAGGLCRLHGVRVVLVDAGAPPAEVRAVLVDALRRIGADDVWLPPALREWIEEKA